MYYIFYFCFILLFSVHMYLYIMHIPTECRSQFQSAQFRCVDFAQANAKRAFHTLVKLKNKRCTLSPEIPKDRPRAVSDDEYIQAAEVALSNALRLMSVCTEWLGHCALVLVLYGLKSWVLTCCVKQWYVDVYGGTVERVQILGTNILF